MSKVKATNTEVNPWTTFSGIITIAIVPLLAFFGIIKPDMVDPLNGHIANAFLAIGAHAWEMVILSIGGIILIFVAHDKVSYTPTLKGNPITTIAGVIMVAIIPLLALFGLITANQVDAAKGFIQQVADGITSHNWQLLLNGAIGFILMFFARDKQPV